MSPIHKYLASKVMDDFRKNSKLIDEKLAKELNQQPYIEELRLIVSEKDISHLLKAFRKSGPQVRSLVITMLLPVRENPKVKSFFQSAWEKYKDFDTRVALMFRLLDYPNLDSEYKESMYEFVKKHWKRFINQEIKWFGGTKQVLNYVRARLSDNRFPSSKAWLYLCVAMGSPDKTEVEKLFKKYTRSRDQFISKVAKELLQILKTERKYVKID